MPCLVIGRSTELDFWLCNDLESESLPLLLSVHDAVDFDGVDFTVYNRSYLCLPVDMLYIY